MKWVGLTCCCLCLSGAADARSHVNVSLLDNRRLSQRRADVLSSSPSASVPLIPFKTNAQTINTLNKAYNHSLHDDPSLSLSVFFSNLSHYLSSLDLIALYHSDEAYLRDNSIPLWQRKKYQEQLLDKLRPLPRAYLSRQDQLHSHHHSLAQAQQQQLVSSTALSNRGQSGHSYVRNRAAGQQNLSTWSFDYSDEVAYELREWEDAQLNQVDVILLTGNVTTDLFGVLTPWADVLSPLHVIILQQGDPSRYVHVPQFLRHYELFTADDVAATVEHFLTVNVMSTELLQILGPDISPEQLRSVFSSLFNLRDNVATARNFGLLVADREFVYLLDCQDLVPIASASPPPLSRLSPLLRQHLLNLWTPAISTYFLPMATSLFFSGDFPAGVPYSRRNGQVTGISFTTALGADSGDERAYDPLTRRIRQQFAPATMKSSGGGGASGKPRGKRAAGAGTPQVFTVPATQLLTLSTQNLLFRRRLLAPLLAAWDLSTPALSTGSAQRHWQLLFGWTLKMICDHFRVAWKYFDGHALVAERRFRGDAPRHDRDDPSDDDNEWLHELFWQQLNDLLFDFFTEQAPTLFPRRGPAVEELSDDQIAAAAANLQRQLLIHLMDYLDPLSSAAPSLVVSPFPSAAAPLIATLRSALNHVVVRLHVFAEMFQRRHDFNPNKLRFRARQAGATRHLLPPENSTRYDSSNSSSCSNHSSSSDDSGVDFRAQHGCVVFTIVYDDLQLLKLWLRYYLRHFPVASVWILNHHGHQPQLFREDLAAALADYLCGNDSRGVACWPFAFTRGDLLRDLRIEDVYGDKAGFPMYFFLDQANLHQHRYLRWNFSCVLLTDSDEIVAPDPAVYPFGLQQYLYYFTHDDRVATSPAVANRPPRCSSSSSSCVIRTHAKAIGQVTETDADRVALDAAKLEPRFQFSPPNLSLFRQRHYWTSIPKYNKPLLSRDVNVRYKPGWHNLYLPPASTIVFDPALLLLHLNQIDVDVCEQREWRKAQLSQTGHQSEMDALLSVHLLHYHELKRKGEVCQFAHSIVSRRYRGVFDNTGKIKMEKIPAPFADVFV